VKVKICGLSSDLPELASLGMDYAGFIFYGKSPRCVLGKIAPDELSVFPAGVKKIGVFVDEELSVMQQLAADFQLDILQLHGSESPELCRKIRGIGFPVIKAFGVGSDFNFERLRPYLDSVDFFLFDTATSAHGGSGKTFDWNVLQRYPFDIPILVGGGVGLENLSELLESAIPHLHAVDMNSKLEIAPGVKNISRVQAAINIVKSMGEQS
jgi:phosphoribosylanthranilate isomerase